MRRYPFERVVQIDKVEVLRSDRDVRLSILARKPEHNQSLKLGKIRWWQNSLGGRISLPLRRGAWLIDLLPPLQRSTVRRTSAV